MKIDIRDYTSPNDFHKSENDIAKELLELRYIDKDFFLLNRLFNKTQGKQNYSQEQMECKYCHGGRNAKPIVESHSDFLAFDSHGIVAFGNDGSVSTGEEYKRLKYCPMCGRRLDTNEN